MLLTWHRRLVAQVGLHEPPGSWTAGWEQSPDQVGGG